MALINIKARQIHSKIVFYGSAHAGKTTTMQTIHKSLDHAAKTDLLSIATETERTLFFDFEHPRVPRLRGFSLRFHLYTVPGNVLYPRNLKILNAADAVIFVINSSEHYRQCNLMSLLDLDHYLQQHGKTFMTFSIVMQYNHSDAFDALSHSALDRSYNPFLLPSFITNARKSLGIQAPLDAACALVLDHLDSNEQPPGPPERLRVTAEGIFHERPHVERWLPAEQPQPTVTRWHDRLWRWLRPQRPR